jgi:GWxTD domain-containing protein
MKKRSILCFVIIALLFSCKDKRISSRNLSALYDIEKPYHLFQFSLYHASEETTELQFRVPLYEFLYKRENAVSEFTSRFSLTYYFYEDFKAKTILDSATYVFTDSINYRQQYWFDYIIPLKIGMQKQGLLRIEVVDKHRKTGSSFTFLHNKNDIGNRQYYNIHVKDVGRVPKTIMASSDTFRITLSPLIKADSLYVAHFHPVYELASPPFSYENIKVYPWKPDSMFTVPLNNNTTEYVSYNKEGLYHFMTDTLSRNGITIFISRSDFPFVSSHKTMGQVLRYLTSAKEYRKIEENPDVQTAVEDFWLNISPNPNVARRLIKEFYTRTQYANMFFTSYKEGWMTDRGMIYIVMGKPNIVYRTSFSEIWIYGEDRNFYSVTFDFRRVLNSLSDNDFVLMRNPTFKDKWYRAVDMWRK